MTRLTAKIDGKEYVVYSKDLKDEIEELQKQSELEGAAGVPEDWARGEIEDHSHFVGSDYPGPSPVEAGDKKLSSVYIPARPGQLIFYGLEQEMIDGMRYMVYSEEGKSDPQKESPLDNPKIQALIKMLEDDLPAQAKQQEEISEVRRPPRCCSLRQPSPAVPSPRSSRSAP